MAQTIDKQKLNEELKSGYSAIARFGQQRVRNLGIVVAIIVVLSIYGIYNGGYHLYLERCRDALNNGFIYAAMALSLALIYKATGVVNFAQGNMAMFGTFIAWILIAEHSFPVWLGILAAMVLSAIGAAGIERIFVRPFDPTNHLAITIVTLAWFLILGSLATVIWGADPKAFQTPFPGRNGFFSFFGARVFYSSLGIWITVLAALGLVTLLLKMTKIGLAFRSVSSNLESSRLVGIHIGRTLQFGWAIAAAVGTLAGCLIAPNTLLSPNFMGTVLIYSFAAVTLGGLDSLGGSVLGGVLIGFVETMVGGYVPLLGSELALATALGLIVLVLLVKPAGLFGTNRVERV